MRGGSWAREIRGRITAIPIGGGKQQGEDQNNGPSRTDTVAHVGFLTSWPYSPIVEPCPSPSLLVLPPRPTTPRRPATRRRPRPSPASPGRRSAASNCAST